ncbi:MAG: enoyl-CoA hydratase-related protein, partial [Proteobacteria bacterium]|nr:enoyl-CoA hydratase-related protein [Pseudomonadota bacterium]
MSAAEYQVHGEVAVITLNNPPVNGLGHALRTALVDGVIRAGEDAAIKALVLIGAGKAFSGGADITEFGKPAALAEPNLHTVIYIIEASDKPVIAAMHAVAMGGGLELALACHFRVAVAGAKIALPEVKLGILPGAGGPQRLPRVVGVEMALNMIVSGVDVPSEQLAKTALFDQMIDGDLLAGALAFAAKVIAEQRPLKRVRDIKIDYPDHEAFMQFARNMVKPVAGPFPAPLKCVDAVAAAITARSFDEGLKVEREAFLHLVQTPESRALRHFFFGERAASKIGDVPADTPLRKIEKVGVIGAGTMGGGISMNFLNAGIAVTMLEMQQEALDRGVATIRKNYESSLKKGKLTQEKFDGRMALLKPTMSYDDLKDADLIIEAVFEEIGV